MHAYGHGGIVEIIEIARASSGPCGIAERFSFARSSVDAASILVDAVPALISGIGLGGADMENLRRRRDRYLAKSFRWVVVNGPYAPLRRYRPRITPLAGSVMPRFP
jgi:hypothetical protein